LERKKEVIIQINDSFRIRSDSRQWVMEQFNGYNTDKETGEKTENWNGRSSYHSSLAHALQAAFDQGVRDIEGSDVGMIVKKIKHFHREILFAIEPFTKMNEEIAQKAKQVKGKGK
jgi:hypothetical protein